MVLRPVKRKAKTMDKPKATLAATAFMRQVGNLVISAKMFKQSMAKATDAMLGMYAEADKAGNPAAKDMRYVNFVHQYEVDVGDVIDNMIDALYATPMQLSSEC